MNIAVGVTVTRPEPFCCRACGDLAEHKAVLSLGTLPLGNSLLTREQLSDPEPSYRLELAFCRKCTLVQVREPIPSDKLIAQNLYFTSSSPSLLLHGREMARRLIERHGLDGRSMVIEVGSNDGTLLKDFEQKGIPVLGIEPIAQSAELAEREHGVPTVVELFGDDLAQRLKASGKSADVIIANYVLELVPNLGEFVEGLRNLLKDDGVAIIEVPYLKTMVEQCRFDGIAHLRLSWFSITSLDHLFRNHGLVLVDAEHLPAFRGGTLRVCAARAPAATTGPRVISMLQDESNSGLTSPDFCQAFAQKIHRTCEALRRFLTEAKDGQRKRIAAYSAGIKASTLLNLAQLDGQLIDFVVDGNPYKHGRYMPGVHLPICSPQELLEKMPDYTLLLALDFVDEIIEQQAEYRRRGGRFLIPVPALKVV